VCILDYLLYRRCQDFLRKRFRAADHRAFRRKCRKRSAAKDFPDYLQRRQHQVANDDLSSKMSKSDQMFFWGNDVGIYFFSNNFPQTICLNGYAISQQFHASGMENKTSKSTYGRSAKIHRRLNSETQNPTSLEARSIPIRRFLRGRISDIAHNALMQAILRSGIFGYLDGSNYKIL